MGSYFLVKSRSIEWRGNNNGVLGRADFGEIVRNLEVEDEQKVIELVKTMVAHSKVGNVNVILDDSVVFAKQLPMSASLASDLESLWTEIPIHPDLIAKKVLITSRGVLALATNSSLYRSIVKAIIKAGGDIEVVVARAAMEFLPKFDLKRLDFSGDEVVDARSPIRRSYVKVLTIILILSIFGTGFYSGWKYRVWDKNEGNKTTGTSLNITPTVQTEPSPTPETRNKDLRFKVLNATETTGLAAQVKDLLVKDGYTEIETGNLNAVTATQSSILVAEAVTEFDRSYLINLLEEKLGTLNIQIATDSAQVDMVITINTSF